MEREEIHKKLEQLLDLISDIPDSENEKEVAEYTAKVCNASVGFLDWIAGDSIAYQIHAGGHSYLPNEKIDGNKFSIEKFNKRGLTVAVGIFSSILEKAKLAVYPMQRDLLEMSKKGGSDPILLTLPDRGRGKKNNRDLKLQAQIRICDAIYQEHGRTGETISSIRNRLRNTEDNEADRKAWDRMVRNYSQDRCGDLISKGRDLKIANDDILPDKFTKLWQQAVLK
ncbi:MAG: hypothetical protein PHX61_05380 [Alphaproteobacteria bacterium]|nr:hypothetical protein [Alphaproteobacteria bacterium]